MVTICLLPRHAEKNGSRDGSCVPHETWQCREYVGMCIWPGLEEHMGPGHVKQAVMIRNV